MFEMQLFIGQASDDRQVQKGFISAQFPPRRRKNKYKKKKDLRMAMPVQNEQEIGEWQNTSLQGPKK